MPIHSFECQGCGDQFEELVLPRADPKEMEARIAQTEAEPCRKCGGEVRRIMSAFSFRSSSGDCGPTGGS